MPYSEIKIRYDVGYNKVVDRKTGKVISSVVWIDEESGEYGQVNDDTGDIITVKGDVVLLPGRSGERRKLDRRHGPRRTQGRRE